MSTSSDLLETPLPDGAQLRAATPADMAAITRLHVKVFGPGRFARTAYRVREGTVDLSPMCHVVEMGGNVVAALRMTPTTIGGTGGSALLGPLVVDTQHQNKTLGRRLVLAGIAAARASGFDLVILVGDLDYYGNIGFIRVPPGQITLPGPVDPMRLLAFELAPGALQARKGVIRSDRDPSRW